MAGSFAFIIAFAVYIGVQSRAIGANDDLDLAFQPHSGVQLPLATKLIDENGQKVALGDFFSKSPVILVLEYLQCKSLCGVTLRNLVTHSLVSIPLEAGRDYQLVAISIDPRDTSADAAAARASYVTLYDRPSGQTGFHFLTGAAESVRTIADTIGVPYRYDSLLDAYIHPAGFIVASPNGVISRYVEGIDISPDGLVNALADAEQDKSLGPINRILLLCHVQGAPLGRFTVPVLAAFMFADLAGGITLIAVFASIRRRRNG